MRSWIHVNVLEYNLKLFVYFKFLFLALLFLLLGFNCFRQGFYTLLVSLANTDSFQFRMNLQLLVYSNLKNLKKPETCNIEKFAN